METTSYNFYDDAFQQLNQNKPVRDVESEEVIRRRARLNAIVEGLRTVSELAGNFGADAPVEKRGPNQEVLKAVQDFNNSQAKYSAEDRAWKNSMYQFKLGDAQRKERAKEINDQRSYNEKLTDDQRSYNEKLTQKQIYLNQQEREKDKKNASDIADIMKGKKDSLYYTLGGTEEEITKSEQNQLLTELKKLPFSAELNEDIEILNAQGGLKSDSYIALIGKYWPQFKDKIRGTTTKEEETFNPWMQPKDDTQIPFKPGYKPNGNIHIQQEQNKKTVITLSENYKGKDGLDKANEELTKAINADSKKSKETGVHSEKNLDIALMRIFGYTSATPQLKEKLDYLKSTYLTKQ